MRLRHNNQGFTLVEMLVVAPIMLVTIITMMSFLFGQFGQLTQQGTQLRLTTDAQLITLSIQDDVFFASAFGSTKNINLVDPHEPSRGWRHDTDPETLIISSPALTDSTKSPNRQPVYIDTIGCEPETIENNSVLQNNIILFVEDSSLYKRVLSAPSDMNTCGTSYEKQTCPEDQSSTSCPKDILLSNKINSFDVTYYDSANNEVSIPETATRIKVEVSLKERSFAEDVYGSSSITLKRLNQ